MPIWLIANWRLVGAALAVTAMLGWGSLGWWKYSGERMARVIERQTAADLALSMEKDARAKDQQNAELTSKLDANYVQYLASIDATRGAFERRLAARLRERRQSCPDRLPGETVDPGSPAADAPGSDDGPGGADFEAGRQLRDAVKKLQGTTALCVNWAGQVGR